MPTRDTAAATIGEIARRTGYPIHRVEYIIQARGIRPNGRAGAYRLFTEEDVEFIVAELQRIDIARGIAQPQPVDPLINRPVSDDVTARSTSAGDLPLEGQTRG
jgi:hypothetical protein